MQNKLTASNPRRLQPRFDYYSIEPWAIDGFLSAAGCLGGSPASFDTAFTTPPPPHPMSSADSAALTNEADRLWFDSLDPNCQWLGANLGWMASHGKVLKYAPEFDNQNGQAISGYRESAYPDQINIWDGSDDMLRTARHETAHMIGRDDFGPGDPDPSTGFAGYSDTMGAYALANYCG